jgi:subtilisin family serine protease
MSDFKEYVVTVKNKSDVDSFYDDMDSENGTDYIPNRKVEIAQLREISRSTHYLLTEEESQKLKNDNRVLAVEQLPSALGVTPGIIPVGPGKLWSQTANFEKHPTIDTNDKNWGLERVTRGSQLSGWGNSTTDYWNETAYADFTQTNQTVITTSSGKNVDIVIVDDHLNANHPEFAVNVDGTGGSRVVLYDWLQHSASLGISTTGSYEYNFDGAHGTHVASTAAGNTQGWARDANIYNINFNYSADNKPAGDWALYIYDYIRAFHASKPINSATGRKNPTIVNNSWGFQSYLFVSGMSSVNYRGTTIDLTGKTVAEKKTILEEQCGCNAALQLFGSNLVVDVGTIVSGMETDITDLINDGIIITAAAGNSYAKMVKSSDLDYNNTLNSSPSYYFCRGASPAANSGVITVGSTNATRWDMKSSFSNYGSRVDIYAPGFNIVGAVYDSNAATEFGVTLVNDPRDSNYKLASISGTSMACPQVTGILACLLEQWPSTTQSEALQYLIDNCTTNQIIDPGVMYPNTTYVPSPYNSLGESGTNSNNRYLFYKKERQTSGNISKSTFKRRPTSNNCYPRQRIKTYG